MNPAEYKWHVCGRKIAYLTRKLAKKAVRLLNRKHKSKKKVYRCRFCRLFHAGSKKDGVMHTEIKPETKKFLRKAYPGVWGTCQECKAQIKPGDIQVEIEGKSHNITYVLQEINETADAVSSSLVCKPCGEKYPLIDAVTLGQHLDAHQRPSHVFRLS